MQKYIYSLFLSCSFASLIAQVPTFNFAIPLTDNNYNVTYDITTDSQGNVYATGNCYSGMDMDPSNATVLAGAAGNFIVKYSSTGAYIWHKVFTYPSGSFGYGYIQGISIDALGNIYAAGGFLGQLDFDPGAGQSIGESTVFYPGQNPSCDPEFQNCCLPGDPGCSGEYSEDMFLVSLNSSGGFRWSRNYGGVGYDAIEKVKVDANGDIVVVGSFQSMIEVEGVDYYSATGTSALVMKFENTGLLHFSFDIPTYDVPESLATDALGNFYLGTEYLYTVDFDPGIGVTELTNYGQADVAIVKFNSNGIFQWAKSFNGFQQMQIKDLTVDPYNDVIAIGYFEATVDFDPNAGVNNQNSVGLNDTYITKLTSAGNLAWVRTFQGVNDCLGIALCTNSIGDVISTGYYKFTVDFNPGAPNYPLSSTGDFDIFQVSLDKFGGFKWAQSYGGVDFDYGTAITSGPGDVIITAGFFANANVDFDPSFAGVKLLTATSGSGIYVQSLGTPTTITCPDNLQLTNIASTNSYYASDYISGAGIVSGTPVIFQAINYVLLSPGFKTAPNVVFTSQISACP